MFQGCGTTSKRPTDLPTNRPTDKPTDQPTSINKQLYNKACIINLKALELKTQQASKPSDYELHT